MESCLSHREVDGLVSGSLAGAAQRRARAHASRCAACQERIEAATRARPATSAPEPDLTQAPGPAPELEPPAPPEPEPEPAPLPAPEPALPVATFRTLEEREGDRADAMRRRLRRANVGVVAGAGLALALAAGSLVLRAQRESARDEATRLEAEVGRLLAAEASQRTTAERARLEAADERAVAAFLAGALAEPDDDGEDALEVAAGRAVRELADRPDVQSRVLLLVGRAQLERGEPTSAAATLGRALDVRRATPGTNDADLAACLVALADATTAAGDAAGAAPLLEEALPLARNGSDVAVTAGVTTRLGLARLAGDDAAGARVALRDALVLWEAAGAGADLGLRARAGIGLARAAEDAGDAAAAADAYAQAVAWARAGGAAAAGQLGPALLGLGRVAARRGQPAAAEPLLREAMGLASSRSGVGAPTAPADVAAELASVLAALDRAPEAEALLRGALGAASGAASEARLLHELGRLAMSRSAWSDAVAHLQKATASVAGDDELAARVLRDLSRARLGGGDARGAEAAARLAVEAGKRAHDGSHRDVLEAELALGESLSALERAAEAAPLLQSALERARSTYGPEDELSRRLARASERVGPPAAAP